MEYKSWVKNLPQKKKKKKRSTSLITKLYQTFKIKKQIISVLNKLF